MDSTQTTQTTQNTDTTDNKAFIGETQNVNADTVGFVDQGQTTAYSGDEIHFKQPFAYSAADKKERTIEEILSRYFRLTGGNGQYDFTSVAQTRLTTALSMATDIDKISGFLGWSGTVDVRLTWNADPMIQGMCIMAYVPPYVTYPASASPEPLRIFLTGCPHVIINIAEDTAAELSIPYVGEYNMVPISAPAGAPLNRAVLGTVVMAPLVPLTSSVAPVNLIGSVFMRVRDLVTYGVSGSRAISMVNPPVVQSNLVVEALRKTKTVSTGLGNLSSWLNAPKDAGAIRKNVGWIVGGAAKVADYLGFSKPFDVQAMHSQQLIAYKDLTTSDATCSIAKFSQNSDQAVGYVDLSGRGVDEMELCNLLSRPNYIPNIRTDIPSSASKSTLQITKSMAAGQVIGRLWLDPADFIFTAPEGLAPTHLGYMSNMFSYWRGAMRIELRPVCTKFHACRVRVVYVPNCNTTEVSADGIYGRMPYTYTHVLDIRDATTYVVDVPYVSNKPWAKIGTYDAGCLIFYVENALVAPENVSSTIDIVPFVSGGENLEFACPGIQNPTVGPWQQYAPVAQVQSLNNFRDLLRPRTTDEIPVIMADDASKSTDAHFASIGDPVRSLRAVLKRFWTSRTFTSDPTPTVYLLNAEPAFNPTGTETDDRGFADMISYSAWLFAFHRGGMRWFAQNYYPARVSSLASVPSTSLAYNGIKVKPSATSVVANQTVGVGMMEPTKFEIPFYNDQVCVNHWQSGSQTQSGLAVDYYLGSVSATFQRAIADDFGFGTLVGAPFLYVQLTNNQ